MTIGQWLSRVFLGYWIEEWPSGGYLVKTRRVLTARLEQRMLAAARRHAGLA